MKARKQVPLLNKHNFNIARLAAKEESRFTLNGIQVSPERTVVTDGHCLAMVTTPTKSSAADFPDLPGLQRPSDTWKPFVLRADDALKIAKQIPAKAEPAVLQHAAVIDSGNGDDERTIVTTDLITAHSVVIKPLSGSFPDIDRAIWKMEDAEFQISLSAELLKKVLDVAAKFTRTQTNTEVRFSFKSNSETVRIDATNEETGQKLIVLVAPLRVHDSVDSTQGIIRDARSRPCEATIEAAQKRLALLRRQVAELEKTVAEYRENQTKFGGSTAMPLSKN